MDFFTMMVLLVIGGSFVAIAAQSIFDSIADQRLLTNRTSANRSASSKLVAR